VGERVPARWRKVVGRARVVGIGRSAPSIGPARGDVHFIDFPDIGGHVITGAHPAVVVRTDRMQRSSTVIVAPMTSAPRSAPENPRYLVPVTAQESGLSRDGYVKCDQLMTFPSIVLGQRAGRLNTVALGRLDEALRFVLGL
jgi:mRNA-degrading endonuclease toxin of MazEF toxin-antitoxin module